MMSDVALRPLRAADLAAVLAVQAQCYGPELLENRQAFEAKLAVTAGTDGSSLSCFIAVQRSSGQALAYLISLPACELSLPAWNAPVLQPPRGARLLYLHDLAVAPAGRSLGLGRQLLERAERSAQALGLDQLGLVAVQGSLPFWQRQGFEQVAQPSPALRQKLASFGSAACWMERQLITA